MYLAWEDRFLGDVFCAALQPPGHNRYLAAHFVIFALFIGVIWKWKLARSPKLSAYIYSMTLPNKASVCSSPVLESCFRGIAHFPRKSSRVKESWSKRRKFRLRPLTVSKGNSNLVGSTDTDFELSIHECNLSVTRSTQDFPELLQTCWLFLQCFRLARTVYYST